MTGLTDVEQNARQKLSMFAVGKKIGLPASFVELRHQIIHEEMPSLINLRRAAVEALRWLYDDYWKHVEPGEEELLRLDGGLEPAAANDIAARVLAVVKRKLAVVLGTYSDGLGLGLLSPSPSRDAGHATTTEPRTDTGGLVIDTSRAIVSLCRGNVGKLSELCNLLVEKPGLLIPTSKRFVSFSRIFFLFFFNLFFSIPRCCVSHTPCPNLIFPKKRMG